MFAALQDNYDEIYIVERLTSNFIVIRHPDSFPGRVSKKRRLKYKQLLS